MSIILKGITQKGKNRVREQGTEWIILKIEHRVLFSQEPGPWWLIRPITGFETASRWIRNMVDKDFEVVEAVGTLLENGDDR